MKTLCIIPARGGSKRIPRKNIKEFLGKPIIAYPIEVALKSKLFDEVMVSTDDKEITEIALNFGAKVPFIRSKKNSNDIATTFDVINEVLSKYEENKINFDACCCIYPTTPLLTIQKLTDGLELLKKNNFDAVFSAAKFNHPIQRSFSIYSNYKIKMKYPKTEKIRTQDLDTFYHDAGQFYWFRNEHLKNQQSLLCGNVGALILEDLLYQDIDNLSDWKSAELKFKILENEI
jgi:pseudaminic acid cytidylyltransferase